jgi:hypothetical protein
MGPKKRIAKINVYTSPKGTMLYSHLKDLVNDCIVATDFPVTFMTTFDVI